MSSPFLGEIHMFAGNFAPVGWATCDGQLLPIAQNTALFSLLGTTYGGNGTTDFALPDLRGRVPLHVGQGPGLSAYILGQSGGAESTTVFTNQMPSHSHPYAPLASSGYGTSQNPSNNVLARPTAKDDNLYDGSGSTPMSPQQTGASGGGQPIPIIQPYLTVTFIIALQGIYPSRS